MWQKGVERWLWCHLLTGCLQLLSPVTSCGSAGQQGNALRDRLERDGGDIFAAMGAGIPCHPWSLQEVLMLPGFFPISLWCRWVAELCVHAEHFDHMDRGTR